jgi:hypothetical protein
MADHAGDPHLEITAANADRARLLTGVGAEPIMPYAQPLLVRVRLFWRQEVDLNAEVARLLGVLDEQRMGGDNSLLQVKRYDRLELTGYNVLLRGDF